jgi:hypothetical protein
MPKSQSDLIESCFTTELGRREFFNRILKVGITGAVASMVPNAVITTAFAASAPEQDRWQRCRQCSSLFYDGYRNKGLCPGGHGHVPASGPQYFLTYDSPGPGQRDWRFCNNCHALFFDGYANKGVCKAGGGHVAEGFNFTLRHDSAAWGDGSWRFCNKCETLFSTSGSGEDICAAGSANGPGGYKHVAAGYTFILDDKRPHLTM